MVLTVGSLVRLLAALVSGTAAPVHWGGSTNSQSRDVGISGYLNLDLFVRKALLAKVLNCPKADYRVIACFASLTRIG